jgi:hypothetical protein
VQESSRRRNTGITTTRSITTRKIRRVRRR